MALYIRDDGVNELAGRLARATGRTKTEAVREALEERLRAVKDPATLVERVARIQARARALGIGPSRSAEEEKAFMDDLSGDL